MKKSYWIQSEQSRQTYKSLGDNIETDICIIGGGITGISIAYYLNQYKKIPIENNYIIVGNTFETGSPIGYKNNNNYYIMGNK